jgi:hypothetical protein
LIRYDPCGHAVDMIRRPYRTTVRPFRDSETEAVIHWYAVPWSNGTLPFPSRINSLDWRPDRFNPSPVGEVTWAPRIFDGWGRIVPPPPGDHVCGDPSDFELGGLYLPDEPPVTRDIDGIPTYCRPAIDGLVIGGEGIRIQPQPFSPGAVVMGGTGIVADVQTFSAGALVLGGEGTIGTCHFLLNSTSPLIVDLESFGFDCTASPTTVIVFPGGWALFHTATIGTSGDWTLQNFIAGVVFTTTAWDGSGTRAFTLSSGTWPGTVTLTHEP